MTGDPQRDLTECIGAIYDAASGGRDWLDVGARLRAMFDAGMARLVLPSSRSMPHDVLNPDGAAETAYAAYYHRIDPFRARAQRDFVASRTRHLLRAQLGPELVPDLELLRSEYYADFARPHGLRHVMGGMIGTRSPTPIGLFRPEDATPFARKDCRKLELLLPHFQRALELNEHLSAQVEAVRVTVGVLDALPVSVVLVDAGLEVRFANAASVRALARPGSGIAMLASGPRVGSGTHLTALHRDDAIALRRLVASAARGESGGSLRIRTRDEAGEQPRIQAALVSPAPIGALEDAGPGLHDSGGLIMVVIEDLARRVTPSAAMLRGVFGFTRAEAEVAIALAGGSGAEEVASSREVSLETVRSQIRAILQKSEAANLRDLERLMATLAMAPAGSDAPPGRGVRGILQLSR